MKIYLIYDCEDDGYRFVDSVCTDEDAAKQRSLVLHGTMCEYEDWEVENNED